MGDTLAETRELVGTCHCGAVRVHVPQDSTGVVVCHCADCQKLHGNAFAMLVADRSAVRWEGEDHIQWYRSSPENERGFCTRCGSRLAKRPVQGSRVMVSVGLFDRTLARRVLCTGARTDEPARGPATGRADQGGGSRGRSRAISGV